MDRSHTPAVISLFESEKGQPILFPIGTVWTKQLQVKIVVLGLLIPIIEKDSLRAAVYIIL